MKKKSNFLATISKARLEGWEKETEAEDIIKGEAVIERGKTYILTQSYKSIPSFSKGDRVRVTSYWYTSGGARACIEHADMPRGSIAVRQSYLEEEKKETMPHDTEAWYIIKGYPMDTARGAGGRENNAYVYMDIVGRLCIHGGLTGGELYINQEDLDRIDGDVAPGH